MSNKLQGARANHSRLKDTLMFDGMLEQPAIGRSGGIVLLWHENVVAVTSYRQSNQEMHVMVKVITTNTHWLFSIIYASTNLTHMSLLWDNLCTLKSHYSGPWLMCGDFNQVMSQNEKWGGRPINYTRANRFSTCMNHCDLVDLGFKGSKYTWSNHRKKDSLILKRLYRGLANRSWISLYPNMTITHLPRTFFDHNPLLLNLDNNRNSAAPKLFRLE
ncbi:hypothetical protein KY289_036658 [Solanum tuberosum]|nr:hypothetical protein KY284_036483 [Solanum tuberosum]KAH0636743.1 hypothetical protein KY289_036658 [Solanum tuberosum]